MPKVKVIDINTECPECGEAVEAAIEETDLLEDPETPLEFACDECGCVFEQAYTYASGTVVLAGEPTIIEADEDEDEDEDGEETEDDQDDEEFEG